MKAYTEETIRAWMKMICHKYPNSPMQDHIAMVEMMMFDTHNKTNRLENFEQPNKRLEKEQTTMKITRELPVTFSILTEIKDAFKSEAERILSNYSDMTVELTPAELAELTMNIAMISKRLAEQNAQSQRS